MNPKPEESMGITSRKRSPVLLVTILLLGVVGAMFYSFYIGRDMAARSTPLMRVAMEIEIEGSLAHLWFEELMGGDQSVNIQDIWRNLDNAEGYARAMLEGGNIHGNPFVALQDPSLRQKIHQTIEGIRAFRSIGQERWRLRSQSGIGSEIDQHFDKIFRDFLASANDVVESLNRTIHRQLQQFRLLQGLLISTIVILGVFVVFLLLRHERRHLSDMRVLQDREASLHTTLNSIGDAVIATDINGNVTRMNPVAETLTEWPASEAVGQPLSAVFKIINAHSRKPVEGPAQKVLRTGQIIGLANHTILIGKDGAEYQIADSGAPIRAADNSVTGVVLVFRDVTEDYALQKALSQNQQQMQSILDNSTAVIYVKDKSGCYLLINRQFEQLFNVSNEQVRGLTDYDLFPREIADKFRENDIRVLKTKAALEVEEAVSQEDGLHTYISVKFPLFDSDNSVNAMCGISTDITERLNSERARQESENKLLEAQKIAKLGHYVFHIATGAWSNSPELDEILGIDDDYEKDIAGWLQVVHPDFREMMLGYLQDNVLTQHQKFDKEYKIINLKTRQEKWVHGLGELKFEGDTPVEMFGTILDISERKLTEAALRRTQKMEAIGQLSGGIAHDFNNQLGVIIGYLDFLQEYTANDEKPHKWVGTASRATLRCMDLTRQLLAFSRRKGKQKVAVDLNASLKELEGMVARTVTPEVEVQYFLADGLWPAEIDPGEYQDAILNLVINARDAMPDGGQLLIETSNAYLDAEFVALNPELKRGEYVQLKLKDTGIGMDKNTLEHMFEPFFTTKPEGQGTGLGLAMVYGFVRRYDGCIQVDSAPGVGTTICLYLPHCTDSGSAAVIAPNSNELELPTGSETILIVDDEVELLQLADQYLSALGYRTFTAENAAQALKVLTGDEKIDLLFSDVVMPGRHEWLRTGATGNATAA
jgi:PAS domain S-box-containing protein